MTVVGDLDLLTSPTLEGRLTCVLDDPGCRALLVDLGDVHFLGTRGVQALDTIRARAALQNVRLAVVARSRAVIRALSITGVADRMAIVPTLGAARVAVEAATGMDRRIVERTCGS